MNIETLKRGITIQENIVYWTKKLAELTEAINGITDEDTFFTEVRSTGFKEKITIGQLLPSREILALYQERVKKEIDCLQAEFEAL